jgi:DNA helicase-2/ATP-dependent DNA helicase PcrA
VRSTCRTCGATLGTARERTIGRCSTCPATVDERLFDALREWRLETAREADVPAFVVFTDATLTAIAETAPADVAALARINGVGPAKLERYGADVLGLLSRFSDSENG